MYQPCAELYTVMVTAIWNFDNAIFMLYHHCTIVNVLLTIVNVLLTIVCFSCFLKTIVFSIVQFNKRCAVNLFLISACLCVKQGCSVLVSGQNTRFYFVFALGFPAYGRYGMCLQGAPGTSGFTNIVAWDSRGDSTRIGGIGSKKTWKMMLAAKSKRKVIVPMFSQRKICSKPLRQNGHLWDVVESSLNGRINSWRGWLFSPLVRLPIPVGLHSATGKKIRGRGRGR